MMKLFSALVAITLGLFSPLLISQTTLQVDDLKIDAPIIYDIRGHDSLMSSITLTNLGTKPLKAVHFKLISQNSNIDIPNASIFLPELVQGQTYKHLFKLKLAGNHHLPIENCNKSGITLSFKESHRQSKSMVDVIKRAQGALDVWLSPKSKGLCSKIKPDFSLSKDMSLFDKAEMSLKSVSYRSRYTKLSDYWQLIALLCFLAVGIYRARKF